MEGIEQKQTIMYPIELQMIQWFVLSCFAWCCIAPKGIFELCYFHFLLEEIIETAVHSGLKHPSEEIANPVRYLLR